MTIHLIELAAITLIIGVVTVYLRPFRRVLRGRRLRDVRRPGARQVHAARILMRAIWRSR